MSKYNCVRQNEPSECGAACITTVCLHYKYKTTITKLKGVFGADILGANAVELSAILDLLGFEAKAWKGTKEALEEQQSLPAIVGVEVDGTKQFVVLHKIDSNQMIVADPSCGIRKISKEQFYNIFTGDIILCSPKQEIVKTKKSKRFASKGISTLIQRQSKLLTLAALSTFLLIALGVLGTLFTKFFIDELLPFDLEGQLFIFTAGLAAIALFSVLIKAVRQHMLLFLSFRVDIPLMLGYFKHIFSLPMKNYETRRTGDVLTRIQDASKINNVFATITLSLFIDIVFSIVIGIILFSINQFLFLVVLLIVVANFLLSLLFKKKYKTLSYKKISSSASLNTKIVESLNTIETIKSLGIESETHSILERRYMQNMKNIYSTSVVKNTQGSLRNALNIISILCLAYFGVELVADGTMTIGTLFSFVALSYYILDPICRMGSMQSHIQEAKAAKKTLDSFFELEKEPFGEINDKVTFNSDIVIKDVSYNHNNRKEILSDINLTIKNKGKIAIVGQTGSGKSTLVKMLLSLTEYQTGSILINDIELKDMCKKTLRSKIAYVPQNVELFSGTILDNIRIGNPSATLQEVEHACAIARCDRFLCKLPSGLDSYVEESGVNFSAGERQKIALARAIVKNPEVIIIDEATTNLDAINETIIINNICSLKCTVIIITHRLSSIRHMDNIVVLDKTILETGTHDQLLENKKTYYNMWKEQIEEADLFNIQDTVAQAIYSYNNIKETALQEKEAKLISEYTKLNEETSLLLDDYNSLTKEHAVLLNEKEFLNNEKEKWFEEYTKLNEETNKIISDTNNLIEETNRLNAESNELKQQINQLIEENNSLKEAHEEKMKQIEIQELAEKQLLEEKEKIETTETPVFTEVVEEKEVRSINVTSVEDLINENQEEKEEIDETLQFDDYDELSNRK